MSTPRGGGRGPTGNSQVRMLVLYQPSIQTYDRTSGSRRWLAATLAATAMGSPAAAAGLTRSAAPVPCGRDRADWRGDCAGNGGPGVVGGRRAASRSAGR